MGGAAGGRPVAPPFKIGLLSQKFLLGLAIFGEPDLLRRLGSALLACAGAACLLFAR